MRHDPLKLARPLLLVLAAILVALGLSACGDSEESTSTSTAVTSTSASTSPTSTDSTVTESTASAPSTDSTATESTASTTTTTASASCTDVETFDVESSGKHFNRDFTAEDYPTDPPTGGDHNPTSIQTGQFYDRPPPLGESVHALEHGAVLGWTKDLAPADLKAVHAAFSREFAKGYFQLAVVENPDLEVPFAMSSWDSLRRCDAVDAEAISSFIEAHYAPSTAGESALACSGKAARLPACRSRTGP